MGAALIAAHMPTAPKATAVRSFRFLETELVAIDLDRMARQYGLSGADLPLIGTLRVAGGAPIRATDLARKMHVSAAVFSTHLVKLERVGLIRRGQSQSDKRASNRTLTDFGEKTADEAIVDIAAQGMLAQAHRRASTEEQSEITRLLAQLHDYLHRHILLSPRG